MTDGDYLAAFDHVVLPVLEEYKPELMRVYAEVDAADGDPVGRMKVTPAGYGNMTAKLMAAADKVNIHVFCCPNKVLMSFLLQVLWREVDYGARWRLLG